LVFFVSFVYFVVIVSPIIRLPEEPTVRPFPMFRRMLIGAGFLVLVMLAGECRAENPRRNVVLLIADDLGLDLGCYGNKVIRTPNIDALAATGTRFTNGFACVSSCSPSRASLYTGMQSHTSGQYGLAHATHNAHTLNQVQSLPKILKAAGYRSG